MRQMENTLAATLDIDDIIDWDSLLDASDFPKEKPTNPALIGVPDCPDESDPEYAPRLGLLSLLLSGLKEKRIQQAKDLFESDLLDWEAEKRKIESENRASADRYETKLEEWKKQKEEFTRKREQGNSKILEEKAAYLNKEPGAVIDYCEMVLSNSAYPDAFPQEYDIDYNAETRMLLVDYSLPSKEHLPTLKEVRYIASRDEFREAHLSESAVNKTYDNLLYQMALRTIHELYEADEVNAIDSIVLNGWVTSFDGGTGQEVTACILSIQASRHEFLAIDLTNVDSRACFRRLKGVGSSKLSGLSPIAPIMQIDKEDRRFVSPYEVADSIDDSTNLAAMDWQDFENLIREILKRSLPTREAKSRLRVRAAMEALTL